jgi:succinate dehydrogenase / fumarate reductase iron-sulfur subunit
VPELISSLPTAAAGLARGKMTPKTALLHPHKAPKEVKQLFDTIDGREQRIELNLYVVGYEDEVEDHAPHDDVIEAEIEARDEAAKSTESEES